MEIGKMETNIMSFTEQEEYDYRAANDRANINCKQAQDSRDFWGAILCFGAAALFLGIAWILGGI